MGRGPGCALQHNPRQVGPQVQGEGQGRRLGLQAASGTGSPPPPLNRNASAVPLFHAAPGPTQRVMGAQTAGEDEAPQAETAEGG